MAPLKILQILKRLVFDVVVIGAGISGSSIAHFLGAEGLSVALIDESGIAGGGSGAAGAFLTPKVGKQGYLKELIARALPFSLSLYEKLVPDLLKRNGVLQIPQDEKEAKAFMKDKHSIFENSFTEEWGIEEAVFLENGSLVDAEGLCERLSANATFIKLKVNSIEYIGDRWKIDREIYAKQVVLATGAYPSIVDEPYAGLRPVWGQRISIKTTTEVPMNLHKDISISASKDGEVAIGATHHQHTFERDCSDEDTQELLQKAADTIALKDVEVTQLKCGVRAASVDHLPLLGRVAISQKSLAEHPELKSGKKISPELFSYYPDLFMINGVGGRGFVLAPLLAHQLMRHMLYNEPIENELHIERFFTRWCKKLERNRV